MRHMYDPRVELQELDWFITLARTQHVTRAASQLYISQPTLSRSLARLESRLGVQLFDRRRNRLRLNKYGEIFLAHAIRATNELTQGEERITALVDPAHGLVSLGFLHSFGGWLVPELLQRYHEVAEGTSFELHGAAADVVADGVRQGRLDVGFVAPRPVGEDLRWIALGREELCLALPPHHRLLGRSQVSIADLVDEPMVALAAGYGLRYVLDRIFREAGVIPSIRVEATELTTLRALVAAGMGVAVIPSTQPDNAGLIPTVSLKCAGAFRDYGAITREDGPAGHAARRFVDFVAAGAAVSPPDIGDIYGTAA